MQEDAGSFAYGFLKSFLKERKKDLESFFVKNNIGFLPEGLDYSKYDEIKNKRTFKQLQFLIGDKHYTLPIILTGLFIGNQPTEKKSEIFKKHKGRIYEKYDGQGIAIMNLATTGFLEAYIRWLTDYNMRKEPSKKELIDFYERILKDWVERSIFVQSTTPVKIVCDKLLAKMNIGKDAFFVFASKSAIKPTKNSIQKLKLEGLLDQYEYIFSEYSLHNTSEELVWIFEKNQ